MSDSVQLGALNPWDYIASTCTRRLDDVVMMMFVHVHIPGVRRRRARVLLGGGSAVAVPSRPASAERTRPRARAGGLRRLRNAAGMRAASPQLATRGASRAAPPARRRAARCQAKGRKKGDVAEGAAYDQETRKVRMRASKELF